MLFRSQSQLQSRALSNINNTTVMRGAWPQDGRGLGWHLSREMGLGGRERRSPSEGGSRRWAAAGRGPAGTRAWLGHGVRFPPRGQRSQATRDIWYLTCNGQSPFSCVPSAHSSPAPPASSPNSGPSCEGPGPPRGSVGTPRLVETLTQPRRALGGSAAQVALLLSQRSCAPQAPSARLPWRAHVSLFLPSRLYCLPWGRGPGAGPVSCPA